MLKYAATRGELAHVLQRVYATGRRVILDYARENCHPSERELVENSSKCFIDALPSDHSMFALKFTSFGSRHDVNAAMESVDSLVSYAKEKRIPVCLDAEDVLYQDQCLELMRLHNTKNRVNVYTTYQLYRRDAFSEMLDHESIARSEGFRLGVKLVRGAYLSKQKNVFNTKSDVDNEYDKAMKHALSSVYMRTILATHNAKSIETAKTMFPAHEFEIAQLMGMQTSDATSVYVPTGTLGELSPYLIRRLLERTLWLWRKLNRPR